jgi:polyhydroxyalkanoate synthase
MGSKNKTFVLSESGHIAGIVNPPSKKKYGHYTNEDVSGTPEEWLAGADYNEGSWWPRWERVAVESVGQAGSGAHPRRGGLRRAGAGARHLCSREDKRLIYLG